MMHHWGLFSQAVLFVESVLLIYKTVCPAFMLFFPLPFPVNIRVRLFGDPEQ
jgi:hypothetical protein